MVPNPRALGLVSAVDPQRMPLSARRGARLSSTVPGETNAIAQRACSAPFGVSIAALLSGAL